MTWLGDTETRWQAQRERDARIDEQATGIYDDLWADVLKLVNEAKSSIGRFASIEVNGRPLAHTVSMQAEKTSPVAFVPKRSLEIVLLKDERAIVAAEHGKEFLRLDIDLCDKAGTACLKLRGNEIKGERAARMIVGAFLYPGLEYKDPSGSFEIRVGGEAIKPPKMSV